MRATQWIVLFLLLLLLVPTVSADWLVTKEGARVETKGPQFSVRDIDLFQDNFSADGTTTGTARADQAHDILPGYNPNIIPGDSSVINVNDPEAGVGQDPISGFAIAIQKHHAHAVGALQAASIVTHLVNNACSNGNRPIGQ